jgi:hypothetical protein
MLSLPLSVLMKSRELMEEEVTFVRTSWICPRLMTVLIGDF